MKRPELFKSNRGRDTSDRFITILKNKFYKDEK